MGIVIRLAIILLLVVPALSYAQESGGKKAAGKENKAALTPEREEAVSAFLKEHNPQLLKLLASLKEGRPRDYEKAVRDIARSAEKLDRAKAGPDLSRYELELRSWKVKTRIQMLVARHRMTKESSLEKQIKEALVEQAGIRRELLEIERDRLSSRLEKINEQLEKDKAEQSQSIEKQLQAILTPAAPAKTKVKTP